MSIETVLLDALDGVQLEADLARVDGARGSVVLAHPHPLFGGDRFNPVIDSLFSALPAAGLCTIRLDFRGVNSSGGSHDDGDSERLDIVAAIELLEIIDPDSPIWLVGYSFGAMVTLNVVDPRVGGWVAIAPPLAAMKRRCLADTDHRSKLLLVPANDQYSDPRSTAELKTDWVAHEQRTIPGADHFLGGHVGSVCSVVCAHMEKSI